MEILVAQVGSRKTPSRVKSRAVAGRKRTRKTNGVVPTKGKATTVGCLFSAIGGFTAAFRQAGAVALWANEKDNNAVATFRHNFPDVESIHKPIEQVTVKGDGLSPVDILTAGFPCQPFSIAGEKQGFDDDRGTLFLHITRLLSEFGKDRPKILLLENVGNFRTHDSGRTFRRVQREIQQAGYWFSSENAEILNTATHTEIPQNRSRIFMVAMNADCFSRNQFKFPTPVQDHEVRSVWDFIDSNRKQEPWYYFTPESQYYEPFREAIEEFGKKSIYQLRRNYVRENKSGQCFTLMANMGVGGHNEPVIKDRWGIRKLTPVECARLQGFDDAWFSFPDEVPRRQRYKQIGNSVTVPLVRTLAEQCIELCSQARKRRR